MLVYASLCARAATDGSPHGGATKTLVYGTAKSEIRSTNEIIYLYVNGKGKGKGLLDPFRSLN